MAARDTDIPRAKSMHSAYLTLDTAEKAEHIYYLLSSEGGLFIQMEKTFFANRFALLHNKFGKAWILLNAN
jgi:PhnB protein